MLGPPQRLPHTGAGLGGGAGERGGCLCAETEAVSSSFEATRYLSVLESRPASTHTCIPVSLHPGLSPRLPLPPAPCSKACCFLHALSTHSGILPCRARAGPIVCLHGGPALRLLGPYPPLSFQTLFPYGLPQDTCGVPGGPDCVCHLSFLPQCIHKVYAQRARGHIQCINVKHSCWGRCCGAAVQAAVCDASTPSEHLFESPLLRFQSSFLLMCLEGRWPEYSGTCHPCGTPG